MNRSIIITTMILTLIMPFITQAQNSSETKLGIFLETLPEDPNNENTYSAVLPPLSLEVNRDLFKYFALGFEAGFAMHQRKYLKDDGKIANRYMLKIGVKGIIQIPIGKSLSLFGGPALGYTYAVIEEPQSINGITTKRGVSPYGFAGLDFKLSDSFGIFLEGGAGETRDHRSQYYTKIGILFSM